MSQLIDIFTSQPIGVRITVNQSISQLSTDLEGALVRVVDPGTSPHVAHGRVWDVNIGNDTIEIEDLGGHMYNMLQNDGVLTIFNHHDTSFNGNEVHTAGKWDDAPSYDPQYDITTFTNSTPIFPDHARGWTLQPNANVPVYFEIVAIDSINIVVRGNATSYGARWAGIFDPVLTNVWYFIIPPVGIDKENGALDLSPCAYPSRHLAFHYLYIMPVAGVFVNDDMAAELDIDPGHYGTQWGGNYQGQYQAWHRNYNPTTGRWTTPDPAAQPWTNLVGYVGQNPITRSDPTGLALQPPADPPGDHGPFIHVMSPSELEWIGSQGTNFGGSPQCNLGPFVVTPDGLQWVEYYQDGINVFAPTWPKDFPGTCCPCTALNSTYNWTMSLDIPLVTSDLRSTWHIPSEIEAEMLSMGRKAGLDFMLTAAWGHFPAALLERFLDDEAGTSRRLGSPCHEDCVENSFISSWEATFVGASSYFRYYVRSVTVSADDPRQLVQARLYLRLTWKVSMVHRLECLESTSVEAEESF
jgi:RHS repeat-associated protein